MLATVNRYVRTGSRWGVLAGEAVAPTAIKIAAPCRCRRDPAEVVTEMVMSDAIGLWDIGVAVPPESTAESNQ